MPRHQTNGFVDAFNRTHTITDTAPCVWCEGACARDNDGDAKVQSVIYLAAPTLNSREYTRKRTGQGTRISAQGKTFCVKRTHPSCFQRDTLHCHNTTEIVCVCKVGKNVSERRLSQVFTKRAILELSKKQLWPRRKKVLPNCRACAFAFKFLYTHLFIYFHS